MPKITKEYEMEQIDLAIRYFERVMNDAFAKSEAEEAEKQIIRLNSRYKELLGEEA
tara:strand:+ start:415 stop:582 length:168 start_codon:yes stop_codon:yes gene_type:complete